MDLYKHLCLSQTYVHTGLPYELQNLFLCRTYPYDRLMCIQDSRRSYRTYATEFNLFEGTRRYHRDYRTCTGIVELILIRALSDTGVPVGTTGLIQRQK